MVSRTSSVGACLPMSRLPISTARTPPSKYSSKTVPWQMWEHFTCIHEHGMPAYGCLDGNASFGEQLTQVLHLADAGLEVVEAEYFPEPSGHGFQISACQSAVGGKTFIDDDQFAKSHVKFFIIFYADHASNVHQSIFLGTEGETFLARFLVCSYPGSLFSAKRAASMKTLMP